MTRIEKKVLILFWIFTAAITSLPYLFGWVLAGDNSSYTGLLLAAEDGNSYLAKMLSGANGAWLFRTPYTAFPQKGFLAFFPYILLGKISTPFGNYFARIFLYHLFRLAGIGFTTFALYRFISLFIEDFRCRILTLGLVTFGGGLGFLYTLGFRNLWIDMPLEFYSPETFGFLAYLAIPHLVWARGFLFLGLTKFLQEDANHVIKQGIEIGLYWNLLALMQPLTVPLGWLILTAFTFGEIVFGKINRISSRFNRSKLVKLGIVILISSPFVVYTFIAFQVDPFLKIWRAQNIILSPPLTDYLLAYGLVIPIILAGFFRKPIKAMFESRLLLIWLVLLPFLIYFPYLLQRRLAEGGYVAMSILAISGMFKPGERIRKTAFLWYSLNFLTTFLFLTGAIITISGKPFPLFLSQNETRLLDFVQQKIPSQSVVLADWELSTLLPAHAPVRVIIGHGPESIRGREINERMKILFSQENPNDFKQFLQDENVDFWIMNKSEAPCFFKSNLELEFLIRRYENSKYILFEFQQTLNSGANEINR